MATHTASLRNAIRLKKAQIRYIAVNAIQDVVEGAQTPQPGVKRTRGTFVEGKIPVDTSALIQSLVTRIAGRSSEPSQTSHTAILSGFQLGDQLQFAWTMPYALRIEKGFVGTDALGRTYNQEGRYFVARNAARFPDLVREYAKEVGG